MITHGITHDNVMSNANGRNFKGKGKEVGDELGPGLTVPSNPGPTRIDKIEAGKMSSVTKLELLCQKHIIPLPDILTKSNSVATV